MVCFAGLQRGNNKVLNVLSVELVTYSTDCFPFQFFGKVVIMTTNAFRIRWNAHTIIAVVKLGPYKSIISVSLVRQILNVDLQWISFFCSMLYICRMPNRNLARYGLWLDQVEILFFLQMISSPLT